MKNIFTYFLIVAAVTSFSCTPALKVSTLTDLNQVSWLLGKWIV